MAGTIALALLDREDPGNRRTDLDAELSCSPATAALVVVDMQYSIACRTMGLGRQLSDEGRAELGAWRFDRIEQLVVPNIQRLLAFFREHRLQIVYLTLAAESQDCSDAPRHMRRTLRELNARVGAREAEILDEIAPLPGEAVINKTTVSAFNSTNIDSHLRRHGVQSVVFTGVGTSYCVVGTARDAADTGYSSLLVEDACADLLATDHEATLAHFRRVFGRSVTTDGLLAELTAAPALEEVAPTSAARG